MAEYYEARLHTLDELREAFGGGGMKGKSLVGLRTPSWVYNGAWGILVIFIAFIVLLALAPWQQVSVGYGKVIAYSTQNRQQGIEAPVTGRIEKWFVQEGAAVKKGEPIVKIADLDPELIPRLELQRQALRTQLEASEKALLLSRRNLQRQESLTEKGLTSLREFELAQIEVAKFEREFSSTQKSLADIEVKLSRQNAQAVVAPMDGTVVRITIPEGSELVSAGQSIATIVPQTDDRAVELLIPGLDVPLVQPGEEARVIFEGWPAVQFSGWPSVAVGSFPARVGVIDAVDDGQGNFRVIIFPEDDSDIAWPTSQFLRQGVRATGWILLDSVPLWWELWRQLNGFPKTVSDVPERKSSSQIVG